MSTNPGGIGGDPAPILDRIAIRGIRAYGRHGANPGERDQAQPFDIELELDVDLSVARASDALGDTVDYADIHARLIAIVRDTSYALLERLGDEILADVMRDSRVLAARISIGKPALLAGATPSVRLSVART